MDALNQSKLLHVPAQRVVIPIDVFSGYHELRVGISAQDRRRRREKTWIVFGVMIAADATDQQGIFRDPEFGAHARASFGGRYKGVGVKAVRNDKRLLARKAESAVLRNTLLRIIQNQVWPV